jgi:REase_DpnII-MboI
MKLLGYDFAELEEEHIQQLLSLEREGVVYTDHWIEELNDFRHVKIIFTKEEIEEYARSLWAYELFLRAGSPSRAADVPGIPEDIAQRADSYQLHTIYGETLGPPYHCTAAFIGSHLENLLCFNPGPRRVILEELGSQALLTTVKRTLDSLPPAIRRFKCREKGLVPWPIDREDDVRDLLYAMLRAAIDDLRTEEPVPSRAGTFKYVDLASPTAKLFIEIKWIGRRGRWKKVLDEIAVDSQAYGKHPACRTLIFLIVDAAKDIPDPHLVQSELSGRQVISGYEMDVHVFVREP